ncbi:hypothetical protein ACWKW6_34340, partial [Dyadobacter jiangsuensis]
MDVPFWKLREMACSNFAESAGEGFGEIEKVSKNRAQKHPQPHVRSDAIITMASYGDKNSDPIFIEALTD